MAESRDPLAEELILQRMADALPTHERGDTSSDLSSSVELVAIFVHACLTLLDFRLLGFDEEKNTGKRRSHRPQSPASS